MILPVMQAKGLVELQTFTLLLGLMRSEDYVAKIVELARLAVAKDTYWEKYKTIQQSHFASK